MQGDHQCNQGNVNQEKKMALRQVYNRNIFWLLIFPVLILTFTFQVSSFFSRQSTAVPCKLPGFAGNRSEEVCELVSFLQKVQSIKPEDGDNCENQQDTTRKTIITRNDFCLNQIFHGPPGTGKTKGAQVIAQEAGVSYEYYSFSLLIEKWQGNGTATMQLIFDKAQERASKEGKPVVLILDELNMIYDHPKYREALISLTAFLDEIKYSEKNRDKPPVITILITNRLDIFTSALISRAKIIEWENPNAKEREEILKQYLNTYPHDIKNFYKLGKMTKEFSYHELKDAVRYAHFKTKLNELKKMPEQYLFESIQNIKDGKVKIEKIKKDKTIITMIFIPSISTLIIID